LKRNYSFLICFFFCTHFLFSENNDCEEITSFLNQKEKQIEHLNLHDPDYISLHYLIAQDIIEELKQFRKNVIPFFTKCSTLTFSELIDKYDELVRNVQLKHDSLAWLSENVYLIFYQKALYEYQYNNEEDAKYYLDRSLQYHDTFADAILLKLNKLLDANHYRECLTLLNTLYYESEMEREQEMRAIEFTDKFYDKLYHTGDSLVKMEHAAEALELFEILEIFCTNLPMAYCNDDYYHGVLRSKSGIYESYIAIARVAEKRGNQNIAAHFFEYAQEYLGENPHLNNYEDPNVPNVAEIKKLDRVEENNHTEKKQIALPKMSPKESQERYDRMVLQALALCIKGDFSGANKLFLEAKKLEECNCFSKDFRVDLMLQELSKIKLK